MKTIYFILFFSVFFYSIKSQNNCNILDIEMHVYAYNLDYSMSPSIDEIRTLKYGVYLKSADCDEIIDSNLYTELQALEKRPSEAPYINDEGESEAFWTSKAIVTIQFSDSTKEELYIMKRGIVWKNRRYENYYPLIESVYYFFPDRYYDKDYYREVDEQMRWEAKKKAVENK